MSPYGIAATAAQQAKSAQVPGSIRLAYARRMAYRALRAACPYVRAWDALHIAKTAANADTRAYS